MRWTAVADSDPLPCSAMSLSELQHHPPEGGNGSQSLERLLTSEGQKLEESTDKQKPKAKKVKKKTRKGLPIKCYIKFYVLLCCTFFVLLQKYLSIVVTQK